MTRGDCDQHSFTVMQGTQGVEPTMYDNTPKFAQSGFLSW